MALQPPELPLHDAGWIFGVLMLVILLVPVLERLRVPRIVGLVLGGLLIGPGGLGLIERAGPMELLGSAGLLYLMFVAGLELDLDEFQAHRGHSLTFGAITFVVPMALGTLAMRAMGFALLPALLLASCWASHTLLTYPVFRRLGTFQNRAVATTVGATILTDTAALLVLVVLARTQSGSLDLAFWATLLPSLAVLSGLLLWLLPRVTRLLFALVHTREARFTWILLCLFGSGALAELAGVEAIIGAFLAGLALNRLVPNTGQLMDRVEFLGSVLLIPLFLISVGMLIDPAVLLEPATLGVALGFAGVALGAKLVAAVVAGRLFGYDRAEIGAMFSLSSAQAAATLAAVMIGLQVGLIETETVNAVIFVILSTCVVSSWAAGRYGPRLAPPATRERLGENVMVPIDAPEEAEALVRIASAMAAADSGQVMPLTIVPPRSRPETVDRAEERVAECEATARNNGAEASGVTRVDLSPAAGIVHTLLDHESSLAVLGWKGTSRRSAFFGDTIDAVLRESRVPILVARIRPREHFTGVLLIVDEWNATPAGIPGLLLAAQAARRLADHHRAEVRAVTNTADADVCRVVREILDVDPEEDARKPAIVARACARDGELVVAAVRPDQRGLRAATTRLARAVPDNPLLIAVDARAGAAPLPGVVTTPAADALSATDQDAEAARDDAAAARDQSKGPRNLPV